MKNSLLLFALTLLLNMTNLMAQNNMNIEYKLSILEPHTHYVDVEMNIDGIEGDTLELIMPVWTPGSYLIREFPKNVEEFSARTGDQVLEQGKVAKHTWQILTNGAKSVSVQYRVYAYELTVRTSYVDAGKAYLNGTSIFMYVKDRLDLPSTVRIKFYDKWKQLICPLKPVDGDKWSLKAANYDELVDSPILIGNPDVFEFTAAGVPHTVAFDGRGNYDKEQIIEDFTKFTEVETDLFGDNPCEDYTYIVLNTENSYGGLEHLNSTSLIFPRWGYKDKRQYLRFVSLAAHEYFHLWNVKRIRPVELGPFDYTQENHTESLWIAEGFTSYYDEYLLRRAGIIDEAKYLELLAEVFNYNDNTPGTRVQPLAESSFDAWIKFYRQNENSSNCCTSYYTGGAGIVASFDLVIRHNSNGEKSLDDVMRYLYNEIYKKKDRGYTKEEVKEAFESALGEKTDWFLEKYVYGCERPDFEKYLGYMGLKLVDRNADAFTPSLGISSKTTDGRLMIKSVRRGGSAYEAGLNAGDEIIAIDNYRIGTDLKKFVAASKPGQMVQYLINRDGEIMTLDVMMKKDERKRYKLEKDENATEKQKRLYAQWMGVPF